jgi:hypothetical protein
MTPLFACRGSYMNGVHPGFVGGEPATSRGAAWSGPSRDSRPSRWDPDEANAYDRPPRKR